MKKIFLAVVVVLLLGALPSSVVSAQSTGKSFKENFPDIEMAKAMAMIVADGNVETVITEEMITGTEMIWFTDVDNNTKITDITGIGIFTNLSTINLAGSQLTNLPEDILQLQQLESLDLANNKLVNLPEGIGSLSKLAFLDISGNQLKRLPKSIINISSTWGSLGMFNVKNNQLITLSQEQYDFLSEAIEIPSEFANQQYKEKLSKKGYLNKDYVFTALPALVEFPNYGVTFAYTLINSEGKAEVITPTITDGEIILASNLFNKVGSYTLICDGAGGLLEPVHYEQSFEVVATVLELKLLGANPLVMTEGESYKEPGYIAMDLVDGDLTEKVVITGIVDSKKEGTYVLTYTVENSVGEKASATRTVIIEKNGEIEKEKEKESNQAKGEVVTIQETKNQPPKTGDSLGIAIILAITILAGIIIRKAFPMVRNS